MRSSGVVIWDNTSDISPMPLMSENMWCLVFCWKVENKKIKKQEVKTKALKGSLVEITEGLKMEDSISSVKDGMKEGMEVGADVKA